MSIFNTSNTKLPAGTHLASNINTTVSQPPLTVTPLAVQMMSTVEAAKIVSAANQIIFTNAIGYGTYRLQIGGANFDITIRQQGMGDMCLTVMETARGNMSTKVVPSEEVFRKSPQEWLQQYLPMMLNEIAVFLKLEYVGP